MFLAVLLSLVSFQTAPFKATLTAATHDPKINTRWAYAVKVTNAAGKPIAAKITVQIKDPLGTVHPVQFYSVPKNVVNYPIKGVFKDAATWPPSSRGFALNFQVVVTAAGHRRILTYVVTPQ